MILVDCVFCKQRKYSIISIKNIFGQRTNLFCQSCLTKLFINSFEEVLPLSKGKMIYLHYLTIHQTNILLDYYYFNFSYIFNKQTIKSFKKADIIIIVDEFNEEFYNFINRFSLGDIMLYTIKKTF